MGASNNTEASLSCGQSQQAISPESSDPSIASLSPSLNGFESLLHVSSWSGLRKKVCVRACMRA